MSRPALLLQRELYKIRNLPDHSKPWGLEVEVLFQNIFEWRCTVLGPRDTDWEGAILKLLLIFDEDFNDAPPKVKFLTIPFHPNIDMHSGNPCTDILERAESWNPNTSILGLLLFLQNLLSNPVLENPINTAAYEIYTLSPRLYSQLVRDSVVASRQIHAGHQPYSSALVNFEQHLKVSHEVAQEPLAPKPVKEHHPKVTRLSFEEYHAFWKSAATTMPPEPVKLGTLKPLVNRLEGTSTNAKMSEARFKDVITQQRRLWYGNFNGIRKSTTRSYNDENLYHTELLPQEVAPIPAVAEYNQSRSAVSLQPSDISKSTPSTHPAASSKESFSSLEPDSYSLPSEESLKSRASKALKSRESDDDNWEDEAMELEEWATSL